MLLMNVGMNLSDKERLMMPSSYHLCCELPKIFTALEQSATFYFHQIKSLHVASHLNLCLQMCKQLRVL